MFWTTKSTGSHYFAFQSFRNNVAITDNSYNCNCCWDDESRANLAMHGCFWRERHQDASVINARPKILVLITQSYL